jgi:hypothetical protein
MELNRNLKDILYCGRFSNSMMGELKCLPLIFVKQILSGKAELKI